MKKFKVVERYIMQDIKIVEVMDLIHLVRSYSKCLGMGYDKVPDVISRSLCHIVESVEVIKKQLDE